MITQVKTGIFVQNQDRALDFYVHKLGFEKGLDLPYTETYRWLEVRIPGTRTTLILGDEAPQLSDKPRLVIETDSIQELYERWRDNGVTFTQPPTTQPWGTQAIFLDSEGNVLVVAQL